MPFLVFVAFICFLAFACKCSVHGFMVFFHQQNVCMKDACLGMLAKSSGTGFRAGMRVPTDEHGLL
jgi:hypothetical protein